MGSIDFSLVDALVAVGVSREQAQRVAEKLERAVDERFSLHSQVLATKRDLAELELKIVREFGQTSERISQMDASLRIAIAESKSDVIKWSLGFALAQTGMIIGALKLLG